MFLYQETGEEGWVPVRIPVREMEGERELVSHSILIYPDTILYDETTNWYPSNSDHRNTTTTYLFPARYDKLD